VTTINDIAVRVQQRLEEETGPPGVFWKYQDEILPMIVEAMNEASLITGVVQVAQETPLTLPADTTYITMPTNAVCLLYIKGPLWVRKTDLYSLDQLIPGWENDGGTTATTPVTQITSWFPLGTNRFGIYPKLSAEQSVQIGYLAYPVTVAPPYTGTEEVPFQQEFQDALEQYAAQALRLKEAGYEWQAGQTIYQEFLDTMRTLSVFQSRHDSLVFAGALGARMRVSPVEVR